MRHFCTYFDYNFLCRGLALYESLQQNCDDFTFYVLALDKEAEAFLNTLGKDDIRVIGLDEYVNYFNIDISKFKNKKQFYFSVTPNICLFILEQYKQIDILFYIDADIYFLGSAEVLYDEMSDHSISICPQRLNKVYSFFANHYGIYNVGINGFRNDSIGVECLYDWQQDCMTWYPNKPGYLLHFFSDQIFLDNWPQKYNKLKVINHIGINTAPWNLLNYNIKFQNQKWKVNSSDLIAFHFSSLKKINEFIWDPGLSKYLAWPNKEIKALYRNYINHIESFGFNNKIVKGLGYQSKTFSARLQGIVNRVLDDRIKMPTK